MNCITCGASNPEGSIYCASCGARISPETSASSSSQGTPQIPRQLRPMGVGDILDETIRLFRQNFRTFIGIVAILQVPLIILQTIQQIIVGPASGFLFLTGGSQIQPGQQQFGTLSSLVLSILGGFAFLIIEAALASAISARYLGQQVTVGGAYRATLPLFRRLFGATLFNGIVMLLLIITIVGIPYAIFLEVRWSLFVQAAVIENRGWRDCLRRSSELVKGNWWRVVGIFIVAGIAQFVVSEIPTFIIAAILGGLVAIIFHGALWGAYIIGSLVGEIFGLLVLPVIPIVTALIYYDLRIRKEGFDLQIMAQRMGQSEYSAAGSPR